MPTLPSPGADSWQGSRPGRQRGGARRRRVCAEWECVQGRSCTQSTWLLGPSGLAGNWLSTWPLLKERKQREPCAVACMLPSCAPLRPSEPDSSLGPGGVGCAGRKWFVSSWVFAGGQRPWFPSLGLTSVSPQRPAPPKVQGPPKLDRTVCSDPQA